jgi:hypothetical protein
MPSPKPAATPYTAVFSPCRHYRYEWWSRWSEGPYCLFICLNPSTADEHQEDPTVKRCIDYAKRWGYGALCMVNLFAWRATDPEEMKRQANPIGPDNDATLVRLAKEAGIVIAAWGTEGAHQGRGAAVVSMLPGLHALTRNQDGSPGHPLYLKAELQPFLLNDSKPCA